MRASTLDKAVLFRSLAVMLLAGLPLHDAFRILGKQSENAELAESCEIVSESLSFGSSLDKAMATCPQTFSVLDRRLSEVAMVTGSLQEVMNLVALYYEKVQKAQSQVWSALAYPAITLGICMVLVVVVPPFVFDSIFELLRTSGVELPAISRWLMNFSSTVGSPWFWLAAFIIGGLSFHYLPRLLSQPKVALRLDRYLTGLPILGIVLKTQAISNFAHSLSIMSSAGVPLTKALPLAGESGGSRMLAAAVHQATEQLQLGATVNESLRATGYFPKLFLLSVAAGEEAGDLTRGLTNTSRLYEIQLEAQAQTLFSMLGPMVTLFIGGIVGFVNLAVLLPLMQLMDKL